MMKKAFLVIVVVLVALVAENISVYAADPMKGVIVDENGVVEEETEMPDAVCIIDGVGVLSSDYVRVQQVLDQAALQGIISKMSVEDFLPSRQVSIVEFFRWFLRAHIGKGDLEQESNLWREAEIKFGMLRKSGVNMSRIEALYFITYHG